MSTYWLELQAREKYSDHLRMAEGRRLGRMARGPHRPPTRPFAPRRMTLRPAR
jgi:hypothetical protein